MCCLFNSLTFIIAISLFFFPFQAGQDLGNRNPQLLCRLFDSVRKIVALEDEWDHATTALFEMSWVPISCERYKGKVTRKVLHIHVGSGWLQIFEFYSFQGLVLWSRLLAGSTLNFNSCCLKRSFVLLSLSILFWVDRYFFVPITRISPEKLSVIIKIQYVHVILVMHSGGIF